jgi:hypothetical protein
MTNNLVPKFGQKLLEGLNFPRISPNTTLFTWEFSL